MTPSPRVTDAGALSWHSRNRSGNGPKVNFFRIGESVFTGRTASVPGILWEYLLLIPPKTGATIETENVSDNDTGNVPEERAMFNLNIKDIARLAGVGVSTVSRVINNHPDVREDTRQRVLQVIEEAGYIPNNSARNLKRNDSNQIGILVKGKHNPFFARIVESIEARMADEGYSLVLHYNNCQTDDVEAAVEVVMEKRLCGMICLGGNYDRLDDARLTGLHTPMVLASTCVDEKADRSLFSSITIDNVKAARQAVDYLCDLGHTRIAVIHSGDADTCNGMLRLEGYRKALTARGLPYDPLLVDDGDYTFEEGEAAMNRLLERCPDLTAVFATSDTKAIGAARAILRSGRRIPEDVSVVGFDGMEYGAFYNPPLTTIMQPFEEMGEKAVELLFRLMRKKTAHEHLVLGTELIRRASCRRI